MISAIIITKNEENNIAQCLQSVLWCDEILVIDDNSEDKTINKILELKNKKVHVFKHSVHNDFSQQRNYGLLKARGDWILFIDADERVSSSLQYEILNTLNSNIENYSGYMIKREDVLWGKKMRFGETGQIKLLRLMKRGAGEWHGKVHEKLEVDGKVGVLHNAILHFPHQSTADFLSKINYYTDIRANELFQQKKKVHPLSIVSYPLAKFILNYFLRGGLRDGIPGIIHATLMSFHSFLVRGKLWSLWQKKNKL